MERGVVIRQVRDMWKEALSSVLRETCGKRFCHQTGERHVERGVVIRQVRDMWKEALSSVL